MALELSKENIADYLRKQTKLFTSDPIAVHELSSDDSIENEGYVNFLFRVSQNDKSYIVKQARTYLRQEGIVDYLSTERNQLEYLSFVLRAKIISDHVPKVYFIDTVNNVFMMDDLSRESRIMRFQLNEGKEFPLFARQIGTFMAKNHFYTSELYLSKETFRSLQYHFFNPHMRQIMEDIVLNKVDFGADLPTPLKKISDHFWERPEIRLAILKVRENFIKKGECLVHGDLHTSNLFVNDKNVFVTDMEYAFVAPFSYDIGYLLANFISQYAAFNFKMDLSKAKRAAYQNYLLNTIEQVFEVYFECFRAAFEREAKALYKETAGYLEHLFKDIFQESLGVMAVANMLRIINLALFPDFDCITNSPTDKLLAQCLSLKIDEYLLFNQTEITTPKMLVQGIKKTRQDYLNLLDQ